MFVNPSERPFRIDWKRYASRTSGYRSGREVLTGKSYALEKELTVDPRSSLVLELKE